jgi:hypothetical protein
VALGRNGGNTACKQLPDRGQSREYVNECIANQRDSLANVYQCSCVIDRIADTLTYDEFVESITFARYAGLPGEGGAIFRDSDDARKKGRRYKELEQAAYKACGLGKP